MKVRFAFSMALAFAHLLGAQGKNLKTLDEIKQWRFDVQHGAINFKLSSYTHGERPRNMVLSMDLAVDSTAITSEEADLLRRVLQEIPSLGYEPRRLKMITASSDESELRGGINLAITRSGKWRSCVGLKYCYEAQKVADQFLKSVDAYKEFDDVLQRYGLKRKRVSMDDMACATVSELGSASRSDGGEPNTISCSGLILIELEKEGK